MRDREKCMVMFEGYDTHEMVNFGDIEPYEVRSLHISSFPTHANRLGRVLRRGRARTGPTTTSSSSRTKESSSISASAAQSACLPPASTELRTPTATRLSESTSSTEFRPRLSTAAAAATVSQSLQRQQLLLLAPVTCTHFYICSLFFP